MLCFTAATFALEVIGVRERSLKALCVVYRFFGSQCNVCIMTTGSCARAAVWDPLVMLSN